MYMTEEEFFELTANRSKEEITDYFRSLENEISIFREMCREYLSRYLMDTDEEHPMIVDITIEPEGTMALSSLEMPRIVSMYQDPTDGEIWLEEFGYGTDRNIDDYPVDELFQIVKGFEKNKTK